MVTPTAGPGVYSDGASLPADLTLSRGRRAAFVASYVLHKTVLLPRDVRSPRLRMLAYEAAYSVARLARRSPLPLRFLDISRVETKFGTFHVRPGTIDAACASPAFERQDIDLLLAELDRGVATGRDIVFVDVGADIGTFSVTVGNHLGSRAQARIIAFEPSSSSSEVLRRNIDENGLTAVTEVRQRALGDGSTTTATLTFDIDEPGCSGLDVSALVVREGHVVQEQVEMSTLDAELADLPTLDMLVLKLDVEGFERAVLEGGVKSVARAKETLLLVEDFVDRRIVEHLRGNGWTLVTKVTPYNSFWRHGS
jgi:FkbM family methyltransferase